MNDPFLQIDDYVLQPRWWCRHGLVRRSALAREWRRHGREWAIFGELARSARCHAWADWHELPFWQAVFIRPPDERGPDVEQERN